MIWPYEYVCVSRTNFISRIIVSDLWTSWYKKINFFLSDCNVWCTYTTHKHTFVIVCYLFSSLVWWSDHDAIWWQTFFGKWFSIAHKLVFIDLVISNHTWVSKKFVMHWDYMTQVNVTLKKVYVLTQVPGLPLIWRFRATGPWN